MSLSRQKLVKSRLYHSCDIALIIGILLSTLIFVTLRMYYKEPVGDDLLYKYVLDAHTLGENEYSVLVSGFSDAIESQSIQYFYSNGRAPIHVIVQMFAGVWGETAFSVFLGTLMVVIIALLVCYCASKSLRSNPLIWLFVAAMLLYFFQDNSKNWYSITGGMNYLFPMLLVISFLLLFRYTQVKEINGLLYYLLFGFVGIIVGWSQECYAVPLSAGVMLYVVQNLKRIKTAGWIISLSLWLGTFILIIAPGNFLRLASAPNLLQNIIHGVKLLVGTYLFWIMIIGLVALRIQSASDFKSFIKENQLEVYILIFAILFGLVANTLPQSFNGISFFSLVLICKQLRYFHLVRLRRISVNILAVLGLALLCLHQYRIVTAQREMKQINHRFIQEYIESSDGVMIIPNIQLSSDVKPFVSNWFTSPVREWIMFTINAHYMKGRKPIKLLSESDYKQYSLSLQVHKKGKRSRSHGNEGDCVVMSGFGESCFLGDVARLCAR